MSMPKVLALWNDGELSVESVGDVDVNVIDVENTVLLVGDPEHDQDIADDCATLREFAAVAPYLAELADSIEAQHKAASRGD